MNNVLFSDEAKFHRCGPVNHNNCRIWAMEQLRVQEWQRDTPKVKVWLGITKLMVYGPFMFGEPVINGNCYLDMLQQFLEPQLVASGILDTCLAAGWGTSPFHSHCLGLPKLVHFRNDGLAMGHKGCGQPVFQT